MIDCGQGQKTSHNSVRTHDYKKNYCWIIKPLMKMHALQHGNPRNLYGKDFCFTEIFTVCFGHRKFEE